MNERLDQTCHIEAGTRDAVHVPFIVVDFVTTDFFDSLNDFLPRFKPGDWIRFLDAECDKFEKCEKKDAHGLINPFIDTISCCDSVVVFLRPGITGPVRHNFNIDFERSKFEQEVLQEELALAKAEDLECAECWHIENNRVTRS